MLAGELRRGAAKLICCLSLGTALLSWWRRSPVGGVDATLVDVVIALSVVYVGVQGLRGRPERGGGPSAAVVFGFGLVHGLGLSTRLQDLGLPEERSGILVIAFNVGVEVGQLVRDRRDRRHRHAPGAPQPGRPRPRGGTAPLRLLLHRRLRARRSRRHLVLRRRGLELGRRSSSRAAPARSSRRPHPRVAGGGHPERQFYGPTDDAPDEDFTHVIGDGYVIVRYRPDLGVSDLRALERLVLAPESRQYVVAAPDPEQTDALRAVTASRTLVCAGVSLDGLTEFRDEWLAELGQQ